MAALARVAGAGEGGTDTAAGGVGLTAVGVVVDSGCVIGGTTVNDG